MRDAPLRRIKAVDARPGYRLAITWERGAPVVVDLSEMISRGGVFEKLSDKSNFAAVRIGENNRVVEWPFPKDDLGYPLIEIDADALAAKVVEQNDRKFLESTKKLLNAFKPLRSLSANNTKA